jgi:hypothetical protein
LGIFEIVVGGQPLRIGLLRTPGGAPVELIHVRSSAR